MSRKPIGDTAMTRAERQARVRRRRQDKLERWRAALERIATSTSAKDSREIARDALAARDPFEDER